MPFLPQTLEQLAQLGANLELGPGGTYMPDTLEKIVRIAKASGAHVTISAEKYMPNTLEQLARLGGSNVTFRV